MSCVSNCCMSPTWPVVRTSTSRWSLLRGCLRWNQPVRVLSFEGEDDVIYLETMAGNIYPESETSYYKDTFVRIQQDALSKDRSLDLITKAAEGSR